jgi:glycosyltransferase involved in cell wall biosynthesis
MEMIRICMITHDQIERKNPRADLIRFRSLGESLSRASHEIVFVTLNDKGRYEKDYYEGSKAYKIPLLSKTKWVQLICFCAFLLPVLFKAKRRGPFDIIFVNSIVSVPGVVVFRWLSGCGFIQFDLMGILSEEKFLLKQKHFWIKMVQKVVSVVEDFLWSRVDFFTTINDRHRQIIQRRVKRPVYVIRDGVHEDRLRQQINLQREKKDTGRIVMIFVGQLNHSRLDPMFRVMPKLMSECPSIHLQILGSGPELERYRRMTDHLGLKGHVSFEGYISHEAIFDYIARADIAYSDDWSIHGFPLKIFEYMAVGKPMVIEGTESVKEMLIDHVNALLYKNEEELKEKILTLAKDSELRKEIGENAKQMMHQHTWEKRAEALAIIYGQYLARDAAI